MKAKDYIYFHYGNSADSSFLYKKIGFALPSDVFYIKDELNECIYVPIFDYNYLKKQVKSIEIRNISELPGFSENYFSAIIDFLRKTNCGVKVPALFPAWLFAKMLKSGLNVTVEDFYFFESALYKNAAEIKIIKKTAQGVKNCFKMIENVLAHTNIRGDRVYYKARPLSTNGLTEIITDFLLTKKIESKYIIVAGGRYSYYPHCQINHLLPPYQPIIIDLGVRDMKSGFFVDVSRTYCLGRPKNELFIPLYNCIKQAKLKLEVGARPGKSIAQTYLTAVDLLGTGGVDMVKQIPTNILNNRFICHHSLGHGVGRELHQLPVINERALINFQKNMVIAFEPGAYHPVLGGIRLEDTYLISNQGAINLTGGHYKFIIQAK